MKVYQVVINGECRDIYTTREKAVEAFCHDLFYNSPLHRVEANAWIPNFRSGRVTLTYLYSYPGLFGTKEITIKE